MTEPEDPEVVAMRERAERVMAKRASAKKTTDDAEAEEPKKSKKSKGGKKWYEWVFDIALFALAGYFIKTRFFDKQPEPPAPTPTSQASAHASASAAPSVVTRASAEMRAAPAPSDAVIETLPPNTAVEVIELSPAGFVKVKTTSGKTGWVKATDVASK